MNADFAFPKRVVLAADIGLDRASYEALELAIRLILEEPNHTVAVRLLAVRSLVDTTIAEYGRGSKAVASFSVWMDQMNSTRGRQWIYKEAANLSSGSTGRLRLALAPMIAAAESELATGGSPQSTTSGAWSTAKAIHSARGTVVLNSLGSEVDLALMTRVRLDDGSPVLSAALATNLVRWLQSRFLLALPNVVKSTQYLLLCSALVRWYAAAIATDLGREEVGEDELISAISIVEKTYVTRDRSRAFPIRQPVLAAIYGLLLDLFVSPADLVHNPYSPR